MQSHVPLIIKCVLLGISCCLSKEFDWFYVFHVLCTDQLYKNFTKTKNTLECMNVSFCIVITNIFRHSCGNQGGNNKNTATSIMYQNQSTDKTI
jgi:hypothetical protein